jgi:hypothetical protein
MLRFTALLVLLPVAAHADPTELCLDMGNTPAQCECATTALNSNITLDERGTYTEISDAFLAARATGATIAESWETAFTQVAGQSGTTAEDLMMNLNAVGQKHETAITSCS